MDRPILLTGATGFLGSRLCASLLAARPGDIYCLVRGRTPAGAQRRLHARLPVDPAHRQRVIVVPGDVRLPRFGLSEADYDELAARVGAVYHCAASVNLGADYERLAPSNVDGVRTVVAFVRHGRHEHHLHHVSTLGTFIAGRGAGVALVTERTSPNGATAGEIGYCQTKLAGEAAVLGAGVPATIYRPGLITGDTADGECSSSDVVARLVRAAASLRAAPDTAGEAATGSVDFTARAITALSLRADAAGRIYHPVEEAGFPMAAFFAHLRTAGYPLDKVDLEGWHRLLVAAPHDSAAFVLLAVWRVAGHLLATTPAAACPEFDVSATLAALAEEGVRPGELDEAYFHRVYRRIFRASGTPAAG